MLVDRIKQALEQAYWAGTDLCPTGTSLDYKSMENEINRIIFEFEKEVYNLEALAALVTEELAGLLKVLADMAVRIASETEARYGVDHPRAVRQSKRVDKGHALAARIREVLRG